jgi:hypothetical protein
LYEITPDHCLVVFLEMNPLKVEFFDCETFVTTIDDLVVSLIDAINYDNNTENGGADKERDNH